MINGIGHIGIFVKDMETALEGLCRLLGVERPPVRDRAERCMKVALISVGPVQLELVEDYGPDGWVAGLVRERGNFIHHFCLLSDDLEADVADLKKRGVAMTMEAPVKGLRGKRIIFTAADTNGGIPVELSEP